MRCRIVGGASLWCFSQVKSRQAEIRRILDSKGIQYELVDIAVGIEVRDEMRSKAGDPKAVPPQLFNEDQYCGVRKTNTHRKPHKRVALNILSLYRFPIFLSWLSLFVSTEL